MEERLHTYNGGGGGGGGGELLRSPLMPQAAGELPKLSQGRVRKFVCRLNLCVGPFFHIDL